MKVLLAMLLLVGTSVAQEPDPTYTFLLRRSSFTQEQLSDLRAYGRAKDDQPARITSVLVAPNTNYILFSVSPTKRVERDTLLALIGNGRIAPVSKLTIRSVPDGRRGGLEVWPEMEDCKTSPGRYVCLPEDFNRDWTEIVISSK